MEWEIAQSFGIFDAVNLISNWTEERRQRGQAGSNLNLLYTFSLSVYPQKVYQQEAESSMGHHLLDFPDYIIQNEQQATAVILDARLYLPLLGACL